MKKGILLSLLFFSIVLNAATTFTVDGITYTSSTTGVANVGTNNTCAGNIIIPDTVSYDGKIYSVQSINSSAFKGDTLLTSIVIPRTISSIKSDAFTGCTNLKTVIWNAVKCANFSTTTAPFKDLANIDSIAFGNEVETIPAYLCYKMSGLSCTIVIPNNINTIGLGAFYQCNNVTNVVIEDGENELNNGHSSYSSSGGGWGDYGYEGYTSYSYTFQHCNVQHIYIGRKVKSYLFGNYNSSWGNGSNSSNNYMNSTVKSIVYGNEQAYMEKYCKNLELLTFKENVNSVVSGFSSTQLREVYVYWQDPPTISESYFTSEAYSNAILHVPTGTTTTYKSRTGWKNFNIIEDGPQFILGDVNGDGKVSIGDVTRLIDIILSNEDYTSILRFGDYNNNGKFDIGDVTSLIYYLLTIDS